MGLFAHLPDQVTIYEVSPRDGLQNESRLLSSSDKISFIDQLSATGIRRIEITSFVHPKWVPQLADAEEVARQIHRHPGTIYSALVPNRKGYDRAHSAGLAEVAVFVSSSETHNKKNVNKSIQESLEGFTEVFAPAKADGVAVRAYVSTVFGCPYEGAVDPTRVLHLVEELLGRGAYQISLGDTIGIANPLQVKQVLELILKKIPADRLALHFHDTRGTALANVLVGLELGITTIDSALGGLGGCPYAPGASGNLATEDLVNLLSGMGITTGVSLEQLVNCSEWIASRIGHELPSRYAKAEIGARARRKVVEARNAPVKA